MKIKEAKIHLNQLGSSFKSSNIKSWTKYLEEEKEEFLKRKNHQYVLKVPSTDFNFYKEIGRGSYGKVIICKNKYTKIYHAAKIIKKKTLVNEKRKRHFKNELQILVSVRFSFAVTLDYFIEDYFRSIFVMPLLLGGELYSYLVQRGYLNEDDAKFYSSQVILALEYLHYMNVMYRDLKPENVLIDHYGYIKLSDFGFSKIANRTYTVCGTPEYIAPEILLSKGYGVSVDWWALGVFIYELLAGISPFANIYISKIYENIVKCNYKFPTHFTYEAKNLIGKLLETDVTKRYGTLKGNVDDIKTDRWFKGISWLNILNRTVPSPYKPKLKHITTKIQSDFVK